MKPRKRGRRVVGIHFPGNVRYRCDSCGAQFHERTELTKFDVHDSTVFHGNRPESLGHRCPPDGWLHMAWTAATTLRSDLPRFLSVSDAKKYWSSWGEDDTLD